MGGWCQSLVDKLSRASYGYREATGLSKDLGPELFERTLGEFLHRTLAFEQIGPLVPHTLALQPGQPPGLAAQGVLPEWHSTTVFHLRKITGLVRESLYELFAEANQELDAAQSAYLDLLNALQINSRTRWVYGTTNYDVIGETVLSRLGFRPDWGELPPVNSYNERRLDVTHLVEAIPRSVPVLHLHGRVGWYRRAAGEAYASDTKRHHEDYGVPIVMLPDLEKSYTEEPIIRLDVGAVQRGPESYQASHDPRPLPARPAATGGDLAERQPGAGAGVGSCG